MSNNFDLVYRNEAIYDTMVNATSYLYSKDIKSLALVNRSCNEFVYTVHLQINPYWKFVAAKTPLWLSAARKLHSMMPECIRSVNLSSYVESALITSTALPPIVIRYLQDPDPSLYKTSL